MSESTEKAERKRPLPFDCAELPKEVKETFLKEIGENETSRRKGLEEFKRKVKEQKDFPSDLSESFLLRFLRVAKFDVDKAFARLEKFYYIQRKHPDCFELVAQKALKKAHLNQVHYSPYRLEDCSTLGIFRYFHTDFSALPAKEKFYLDMLIIDEYLESEVNQLCGATMIMDCGKLTLRAILNYSLSIVDANCQLLTGAFPFRVKGLHMVNPPAVFKIFFNMVYPIMPKKLRERLHVHSDNVTWRDLHAFISPEILPREYGGHLEESSLIPGMTDIYEKERKFRRTSPYTQSPSKN